VVSNHVSYADQYLLVISLDQEMIFMAKEELFRYQPLKFLVESFGAFPVRRGGMDRKALSEAGQVLDQGLTLFMFPEGTRSKNARLKPAYPGTALIALRSGVPILPVGITGMEFAEKDPFWLVFHRPQITVNIGRPFHLTAPSSKPNKAQLGELAGYIMEQIAALLPRRYRGHYGGKRS
jgi:1-acyl-sn-glycerol-3-phosphate acyltransferase